MSLLKYFKLKTDSLLPNPNGHLSKVIPSSSIIDGKTCCFADYQNAWTVRVRVIASHARVLIHGYNHKEVPKYLS